MTDKELLAICQIAFEAIPDDQKSFDVLREMKPDASHGFAGQVLAATMVAMIDEHLHGGL